MKMAKLRLLAQPDMWVNPMHVSDVQEEHSAQETCRVRLSDKTEVTAKGSAATVAETISRAMEAR